VVPPTSTTKAASFFASGRATCARKEAPRIELVGPELNVRIGRLAACGSVKSVPSLLVTKIGHVNPRASAAVLKPPTVLWAKGSKLPFRIAAFSRSSKPILATRCETVTKLLGSSLRTIRSTCSSCLVSKSMGEKTPQMTTELIP
jgi:hypothetical protein